MAKSPFSNPFSARPASTSPLASIARDFGPRITVISVEESARAAALAAELQAGGENLAPRFVDRPTPAPYTTTTPVAVPLEPEAGGSKT
jgi:hypothetical protein